MSSVQNSTPTKIHFVGSIPLADSTATFKYLSSAQTPLGAIKRLPDGETGDRNSFVIWQTSVFEAAGMGHVIRNPFGPNGWRYHNEQEVIETMSRMPELYTRYDDVAIESYQHFRQLRDQGETSNGVRFQACFATPVNFVLGLIQPDFQEPIMPLYSDACLRSLRKTQVSIPHQDLTIQIDMAFDMALLHNHNYKEFVAPVKYPPPDLGKEALLPLLASQAASMANAVDDDVELGFHFCYGDHGSRHFFEPPDTAMVTEYAYEIFSRLKRPVSYFHFPVPIDRTEEEYFQPLKDKLLPHLDAKTEIYAGLIHPQDLEGTQKRLSAARKVLGDEIGIATECGLGRKDQDYLDGMLDIARRLQKV